MLEAHNALNAEVAYQEIDSLMSDSVLFPDVKEDLLSPDARHIHHTKSTTSVARILNPNVSTMEKQWASPGGVTLTLTLTLTLILALILTKTDR